MRSDGWEVNTWQGREKEGMSGEGRGMQEQICSKYQLDRYIMSSLWSLRSSGRIRCLDRTSTFRCTCETSQPGAQTRRWALPGIYHCYCYCKPSEERRAARHTASTKPKTGPRCPQCSRICTSDFGLRSHMRSHDKTGNT